jgi:hypothetical protein
VPGRRTLVLAIRGTSGVDDALTDAALAAVPFDGGHAHGGMLRAASWLARRAGPRLRDALAAAPGYALVVTGHSLGGGAASLVTMMLAGAFPGVRCVAFAPPAVVSADLRRTGVRITSLVCECRTSSRGSRSPRRRPSCGASRRSSGGRG